MEMEMEMEMKIVTYNINGLRPRISQFGSLLKFLSSLDADIICLQETKLLRQEITSDMIADGHTETKLSRQELTSDMMIADGYESFFSCTRTTGQGRVGYSGVATFCRVKSAFSSNEVTLPLAAEEGFTGLLETSRGFGSKTNESPVMAEGLKEYANEDLLKIDNEGRCIITDHGHFVLFNLYGPCVTSDDTERIQFKLTFFEILQKRWELLLHQGRRIIVVGDLNIAPAAIDRCDATLEFENNEFRKWLRSMLVEGGGPFFDTFRSKHPERREAYTCWAQHNGSEQFNFGSRIDHILVSKSCLHEGDHLQSHSFLICHVKECDIMSEFQRWKPGIAPRWKGGRSIKLEGSDHAPVYAKLIGMPDVQQHSTPLLSSRYAPIVRGVQQTIASVFLKRHVSSQLDTNEASIICSDEATDTGVISCGTENENTEVASRASVRKRPKKNKYSQLSLKSFFLKSSKLGCTVENSETATSNGDENVSQSEFKIIVSSQDSDEQVCDSSENEKNSVALMEWQRIQQLMQSSIPLCKGHGEACVARVVKKAGPSYGRRFYVCCRPEGPASNPDTNCGFFKWAVSKSRQK